MYSRTGASRASNTNTDNDCEGPCRRLLHSVLSAKNITLARPTVFNYVTTREEFEDYASRLFGMMIENKWTPKIHSVYPLDQAAKAHQDLESRKTVGKLLLDTMLAGEAAPGSGRAIRAARGE